MKRLPSISKRKTWIAVLLGLLVMLMILFFRLVLTLPQLPDRLHDLALSTPSEIYSDSGELILVLTNRKEVRLSQVSPYFIKAILAMEDAEFFRHHGINKKGLMRALFNHFIRWRRAGGGSSITQQLAKNLYFSFERSWGRKVRELLLACQMEQRYTKEEILEAYCNQIDFGSNAFGIEQASETYFAKHADELTLAEAAFLANLPRWPSRYNPYLNFDLAKERQRLVLSRMVAAGFISEAEKDQALAEPLQLKRLNLFWGKASYYVDQVKRMVENLYSPEVLSYGGLKIYTALDTRLQNYAQEAVQFGLSALDRRIGLKDYELASEAEKKLYLQAALVAIDPRNGKVKALVGGRDFASSPFNRAISNNRLPGSAFKPFVYLAAIDQGKYTPASIVVDSAVTFEFDRQKWSPPNFDRKFRGPITLKTALTHSINVVTAKLIYDIGPETVVQYAQRMGITSPLAPNLSLALGTSSVSPLELCRAYCPFANGGIKREPLILKFIEDYQGNLLREFTSHSAQVVDPQSIYMVLDMLRAVVEEGTARSLRDWGFHRPAAGKTGTTNDARDLWFIGFTPELVTAVWVGYDDNRPVRDANNRELTGGAAAIPIWVRFMENALQPERYRDFPIPEGILFEYVDPTTGEVVPSDYPNAQQVALKIGTVLPRKEDHKKIFNQSTMIDSTAYRNR
ncbi:MAG: PBP1A family penicillin-binding protein [candidate division KSB1 bacterium]|nr:PBP1A family penicillin-binding protein [candidate division KSB1 bacterium]MDZ7335002.1 PBP1A family penicillin-binding protein [candidate division KSB1 bacterium]MDZ7358104.1 PBP1A family penicillin-binding protein [candidate division KSB1 bacterium]MDZ7400189.1 PBP1A family penicillin-binding protein [candidate division KSB1 bacterium]